jgi:hypothetical protein
MCIFSLRLLYESSAHTCHIAANHSVADLMTLTGHEAPYCVVFPVSSYFRPLSHRYLSQHHILKGPQPASQPHTTQQLQYQSIRCLKQL